MEHRELGRDREAIRKMILTIITINRNNAAGLERTMQSVAAQTRTDFEYIVVDGASTDGSQDVIQKQATSFGERIHWISEPDAGIYSAMNKGIQMAMGDYVEFLNSGDCLASKEVVEQMFHALEQNDYPNILYGNMLKAMPDGQTRRDRCFAGKPITLKGFIRGSLNHSPAYIRRTLFDKYGLYDESMKVVSDWKWYLQAVVLGEETPVYTDLDVTQFDMTGISETNVELREYERRKELQELIPAGILTDYDTHLQDIERMEQLRRHPWAFKLTWFLERCLFKLDKNRLKEYVEK